MAVAAVVVGGGGGGGGAASARAERSARSASTRSTSWTTRRRGKLRRFISDRGKIEPRRKTGTCARHQRRLTVAIKRARHLALLPYTRQSRAYSLTDRRTETAARWRAAAAAAAARRRAEGGERWRVRASPAAGGRAPAGKSKACGRAPQDPRRACMHMDPEQQARLAADRVGRCVLADRAGIHGVRLLVLGGRARATARCLQVDDVKRLVLGDEAAHGVRVLPERQVPDPQGAQRAAARRVPGAVDELTRRSTQAEKALGVTVDQAEFDQKLRGAHRRRADADQRTFADALRKQLRATGLTKTNTAGWCVRT